MEPDPREEYRESILKPNNINLSSLRKNATNVVSTSNAPLKCEECGNGFYREGNLRNHIALKHPILLSKGEGLENAGEGNVASNHQILVSEDKGQVCKICSNPFGSRLALERHMKKKHLTCSICKITFETPEKMEECRAKHTTCNICKFNAKFPSKLERHMQSHK